MSVNSVDAGKRVFNIEIEALKKTRDILGDNFVRILKLIISCRGKVILSGMGKAGHVASKIASTFSSLGTPAFFLHPCEALHGDLGMISKNDLVMLISFSGESDEIVRLLFSLKGLGTTLIGITGNLSSRLARLADYVEVLPVLQEACYLGLAPTASTTAVLCYGDALAVSASKIRGFNQTDFAMLHPAGTLGRRLSLKVDDLMKRGEENAVVMSGTSLKDAMIEMGKKKLDLVTVINENKQLMGIVPEGEIRRQLELGADIYRLHVDEIMTTNPVVMQSGQMAVEAFNIMKSDKRISSIPILKGNISIGTIQIHDIMCAGIIG